MPANRTPASPPKPTGPGRPKDPAKRAAILEAAKRIFTQQGFDGTSMDKVATEAGVSKLTVYSHFGDKEGLFSAVVRAHCEQQMPSSMFEKRPDMPLRERLMEIAQAFYTMISSPEAVAGHRMMCSPQMAETPMIQLFWESGPMRVQGDFAHLLERRIETGELRIADVERAASQFFTLLKGEHHARLVFGCAGPPLGSVEEHLSASVDMFLAAYAVRPHEC
ncbi:TetR/AcrR family transcriptional regulator [Marilutibacter alkalisoli]|uniref:TetR/AcrR family transcriptional regulator n=1 Tax=Marilutibacter alkalisoli TaxID=2591633 RepID=A0A514BP33_9GAMM|nr:TetR/AcrR family transcriptional regulator [Lysobacter alkalisoli]QDH69095.1 TetR/AcrR family transcriptional regulator [Lysobacter alkalisoli]